MRKHDVAVPFRTGCIPRISKGGHVSQAFLDDAREFENLRISADEMRRRIRARYQVRSA